MPCECAEEICRSGSISKNYQLTNLNKFGKFHACIRDSTILALSLITSSEGVDSQPRLSHTEHGWAHDSITVYSVIHGLIGTSIKLQPCLGMRCYNLDSNAARVCTNKARIYSIKQGLSRFEHHLQNDFHTIVVRFQVRSSTVCYGLVR